MFIIVNHGDRQSFCRNFSKVYSQKLCTAVRTTNYMYTGFFVSAFVFVLELTMDVASPKKVPLDLNLNINIVYGKNIH